MDWFQKNTHLQSYVRHFEVLVPIWEMRTGRCQPRFTIEPRQDSQTPLFRAFQGLALQSDWAGEVSEPTTAFQPASKNATMDEIFGYAQALFPLLCAVTVEGGHCKRPPKVQYFREEERTGPSPNPLLRRMIVPLLEKGIDPKSIALSIPDIYWTGQSQSRLPMHQISNSFSPPPCRPHGKAQLPALPNTTTLVLKGAWNIIRSSTDFSTLASALPSLREFHCSYHKPKTGAYIAICDSLKADFPPTITNLNLCLEGLYTKSSSSLKKWRKLYPEYHLCRSLGAVTPQLESLAYTGRVCGALFSSAVKAVDQPHGSCNRLKSIDIVVSNVCREPGTNNDATGIHSWPFIQAFEALVLQAVRSLHTYPALKHIRIRFVDLDSPAPLLNPSFHLEGNKAWGFWSDEILRVLQEARPQVAFGRFPSGPREDSWTVLQDDFLGTGKLRSTSVEYYKAMAQAGGGFGI